MSTEAIRLGNAAHRAMIAVTDPEERAVLLAMNGGEAPVPLIPTIASDLGLPLNRVREIVRAFHELGLAEFGPLMREDECVMAGR
jgi:hypothetical protein